MSVLANFDLDVSFWELNPQFKVLGKFATFYRKDTSKAKNASSKVMWAIAFFVDRDRDNKIGRLPTKDKKKIISEELIKDPKFRWNKHIDLIDYYKETQLSRAQRSLSFFEDKMEDREDFLDTQEYTLENAKELDSIIANTEKLFSVISKLITQVEYEETMDSDGIAKGGRKESAGERKEL